MGRLAVAAMVALTRDSFIEKRRKCDANGSTVETTK